MKKHNLQLIHISGNLQLILPKVVSSELHFIHKYVSNTYELLLFASDSITRILLLWTIVETGGSKQGGQKNSNIYD